LFAGGFLTYEARKRITKKRKKEEEFVRYSKLYIDEMDGGVYVDIIQQKRDREKKKNICISACTGIEILSMII
jgi:hypothetical protein